MYGISPFVAVGFEGAYATDEDNDRDLSSLFALVQLRAPMGAFVPYISAGLGLENRSTNELFEEADDSVAARLGPGVEFFLSRNWALNVAALRTFGDKESFDHWQYRGGVKYYF